MTRPLILIVDDQQCVAQAARHLLESAGMDVLIATSPAEATAIWESRKRDVNLLMADFNLGESVTGEQLANNFETDKPSLRSIIITADSLDYHQFPGRTEGVDFVQKPWDGSTLISAVQWLLKNQGEVPVDRESLAC